MFKVNKDTRTTPLALSGGIILQVLHKLNLEIQTPHLFSVMSFLQVKRHELHHSFRKYTFSCLGPLTFADVSIFLQKISVFCPKTYLYSKQQCEGCVRDSLVLFSVFVRKKVPITENIIFADPVSGIRPPDCSKLTKNSKNDNDVIIFRHDVNVRFS